MQLIVLYYCYMRKLFSVLGIRSNFANKNYKNNFDWKKVGGVKRGVSSRKQFQLMARFGQLSSVVTSGTL